MLAKQLVEITFPHKVLMEVKSFASEEPMIVEAEDTLHDLRHVRDERGMVKFRSVKSQKFYFQAQGYIWYAEVEADGGK